MYLGWHEHKGRCCTARQVGAAHLPVVVVGLAGPLVGERVLLEVVPSILYSQAAAQIRGKWESNTMLVPVSNDALEQQEARADQEATQAGAAHVSKTVG